MKKLMNKMIMIGATVMASSVVFLLLVDGVIMPYIVKVKRVRVPEIDRRSPPDVAKQLQRVGLRIAVRDSVYSEQVGRGQVVDQTPVPGQLIKKGRRIFVDISRGPRLHEVPDVKGGSIREARLKIAGNQLHLDDFVHVSSGSVPEGVVVSQEPQAGTRVPRGDSMRLEVSSGSPFDPKLIPDITGISIDAAEDTLRRYEMRLGAIIERIVNSAPPGVVMDQQPRAGQRTTRNSAIKVIVSVSFETASSPDSVTSPP